MVFQTGPARGIGRNRQMLGVPPIHKGTKMSKDLFKITLFKITLIYLLIKNNNK